MGRRPDALTALRKTTYLGSHPAVSGQHPKIDLIFTKAGVVLEKSGKELAELPWSGIVALEADTKEDIERRVTGPRLLALGLWAFVAKKETRIAYVVITDKRGDWIFSVPDITAIELRSGLRHLQPYVPSASVPELPVSPTPAPPPAAANSPADRLRALQELHDSGLISDEEFNDRRAAILDAL